MQGKLGFFFGGLAALCYVWAFFRVPEVSLLFIILCLTRTVRDWY